MTCRHLVSALSVLCPFLISQHAKLRTSGFKRGRQIKLSRMTLWAKVMWAKVNGHWPFSQGLKLDSQLLWISIGPRKSIELKPICIRTQYGQELLTYVRRRWLFIWIPERCNNSRSGTKPVHHLPAKKTHWLSLEESTSLIIVYSYLKEGG